MTREEAIEIIMCGDISNRWGDDGKEAERMAIKALEQETVTEFADRCRECGARYGKLLKQEPKTGRWIYQKGYVPYKWKCNQCSAEFKTDFNYCPNCGCRMVEPQESEVSE